MDYMLTSKGLTQLNSINAVVTGNGAFDDFFDVDRTKGTINVNDKTALNFSSVYEAVQIIAGDVARIMVDVFEPVGENEERRNKHPAYKLLNRKAAPHMTAYTLRETMQMHCLLRGNGYARIHFNNLGRPEELELLNPVSVTPKMVDGVLIYELHTGEEKPKVLQAYEVLHIKNISHNGLVGLSTIELAKRSIELGLQAEKHGVNHFKKGARPNLVLEHDAVLDPDAADKLATTFQAKHSGADNIGRPAIAAGGLKVTPLSIPNSDSQWLESREFQRQEIASWFGLPPHKLGDSSKIAYNSIEAEERAYTSQTLMRWFKRWETEADSKLLSNRQYQASWHIEHDISKLIQGDSETQVDTVVKLRTAMILTQNESRKRLGMPTVEGGDEFENPATSSPDSVEDNESDLNEGGQPSETEEQVEALLTSRWEQLEKTYNKQMENLKGKDEKIVHFQRQYSVKMAEALKPILDLCATIKGGDIYTQEDIQINLYNWMNGSNEPLEGIYE